MSMHSHLVLGEAIEKDKRLIWFGREHVVVRISINQLLISILFALFTRPQLGELLVELLLVKLHSEASEYQRLVVALGAFFGCHSEMKRKRILVIHMV